MSHISIEELMTYRRDLENDSDFQALFPYKSLMDCEFSVGDYLDLDRKIPSKPKGREKKGEELKDSEKKLNHSPKPLEKPHWPDKLTDQQILQNAIGETL